MRAGRLRRPLVNFFQIASLVMILIAVGLGAAILTMHFAIHGVEVPDMVGVDERMAALKLRRVGLAVGATAALPYASAEEGTVLAQDPPAHAQGIAGPSINLLVAAPVEETPDGFVMPDFTGVPI